MFFPPYFRNDILEHIRDNFMFYFGYNDFFVYAATITAILFINALIAGRFFRKTEYFPKNRACFCFDGTKFSDKLCGGLLLLSFALYAGSNALLITDMNAKDLSEKNYCKISRRQPQVGDYVIVRKDADETEACKNNSSVYENRVYKIYYIGSANDNQAISEN